MAYNVRVENKRGFESMFKAFRRAYMEAGIAKRCKKYEFYEKPSDKRRRKIRERELEIKKEQFIPGR